MVRKCKFKTQLIDYFNPQTREITKKGDFFYPHPRFCSVFLIICSYQLKNLPVPKTWKPANSFRLIFNSSNDHFRSSSWISLFCQKLARRSFL